MAAWVTAEGDNSETRGRPAAWTLFGRAGEKGNGQRSVSLALVNLAARLG